MKHCISWLGKFFSYVKEPFCINVPEQHRPAFRQSMYVKNMIRISRIAWFTVLFEALLLVSILFAQGVRFYEHITMPFTILSFLTGIVALVALSTSLRIKRMPNTCPIDWTRNIDVIFCILLNVMSVVMAYFDITTEIGIFVSLIPLIISCTLLYIKPKMILAILTPTCITLVMISSLLLENRSFVVVYAVNIVVCCIFLCAASIASYAGLVSEYTTQAILEAKNNELKRINDQLRDVNRQLYDVSSSDPLTSLPNRNHLERYIEEAISRSHSDGSPIGVLMLDIDAFKAYNDALGHAAGDRCLVEIASEIKNEAHFNGGFAARYGGEEFVVIICNCTRERLTKVGYAICRSVENQRHPHPCSPVGPYVTISAGGALETPKQDCEISQMISRADKALYDAKTSGRNRFIYSA